MKKTFLLGSVIAAMWLAGCGTPIPPGAERGPNGTIAYDVLVESSPPGAKIEANGEYMGVAPLHLKIFGDRDGTFHDFGAYYFVVRALPVGNNQYAQTRAYRTGKFPQHDEPIPKRIYFDMTQAPVAPPAGYVPAPGYYYGPPPVYYYPPPGVRFYFGHRW